MERSHNEDIVVGRPTIGDAERAEVAACLASGWLGTGPRTRAFEEAFARYEGVDGAVALQSCTAALHLALVQAGIGPGDEVITTPITFCATVNAIADVGARPVLADVLPGSLVLDPAAVEAALTPRTRAIVAVHFAGFPCDVDALAAIAEAHELVLVEDCAHAIETRVRGRAAGTFGRFGCFSFHVTKNVTTGDGGMLIAREATDLARIRRLASHGVDADAWERYVDVDRHDYEVVDRGYKYAMTDLQASLGIHQLERIEESHSRRSAVARAYDELLADLPLTRPPAAPEGARHAHHLYVVQVDGRGDVLRSCAEVGVRLAVHYRALSEHRYYRDAFGCELDGTPVAVEAGRRVLSLPIGPAIVDGDVERVVAALRRALDRA